MIDSSSVCFVVCVFVHSLIALALMMFLLFVFFIFDFIVGGFGFIYDIDIYIGDM